MALSRADMELSNAEMDPSNAEVSVGKSEAKLAKITFALFMLPLGYGLALIILALRKPGAGSLGPEAVTPVLVSNSAPA
jgi:hypothetical protein